MSEQQFDDATVEWIVAGEDLLEKAGEVSHDIEERVERTLDTQPPPSAPPE
jgi:hypothetical protein